MLINLFSMENVLFLLRYTHIIAGITWIGVLWYINFIQGPFMASAEAVAQSEAKKKLFPNVMWYFRWGAMLTWLSGAALITGFAHAYGGVEYLHGQRFAHIYPGFIFATVMFLNVWLVIWPRQKKIIAAANGEKVEVTPAMVRRGFLASRTNTLLSVPMLFFMAAAVHLKANVFIKENVHMWFGISTLVVLLIELNALFASNGITTKPIEKVRGVIISGFALTFIMYVLLGLILYKPVA